MIDSDAVTSENGDEAAGERSCALDGCDNPVPPPAVTADGRRKGGRPSAYCCKAHADAASRARRAAQTAAITDPITEMARIAAAFDPAARDLLGTLTGLQERFAAAENGALGRVRAAETEAEQARRDADDAARTAERAETERAKALAAARDDRQARAAAEQETERATTEADEKQRRAWEQVAAHERARGAAESAQAAAEAAHRALAADLRGLRDRHDELAGQHTELRRALTTTQTERDQALRDRDTATDRLAQAERDQRAVAADLADARSQLQQAHDRAAAADAGRRLAEQHATALTGEVAATRDQLAAANARIDRLVAGLAAARPDTPPHTGACPSCGHAPRGGTERAQLRGALQLHWLELASDGAVTARRHCPRCTPAGQVTVVECGRCGDARLLSGATAARFRDHLAAAGWHLGDGDELAGSACPRCVAPPRADA